MNAARGAPSALPVLALVAVAGAALAAAAPPNHDVAWLWLASGRLLDGGVPGRDIWETNPPLILWMMAPVVFAARLFGADHHGSYVAAIAVAAAASTFACAWIARPILAPKVRADLFAAALLACLLLLPGPGFGQREHLLAILVAPYMFAEAIASGRDDRSRGPGLAVCLAAAVGLLLKPHLAVLVAGFVALRVARARSPRPLLHPGYLLMLGCAAAYGAAVLLLYPDWVAMTRVTALVYSAYDPPTDAMIRTFVAPVALLALAWAFFARHGTGPSASAVRALLFASALLLLGALLQRKGWPYHKLPSYFALAAAGLTFLASRPAARPSVGAMAAALLAVAFPLYAFVSATDHFGRRAVRDAEFSGIVERANGAPVAAFSTNIHGVFPELVEMDGAWASRFPCQWLIPGIVRLAAGAAPERREAGRLRYMTAGLVASDIARYRPAVIALKKGPDQAMATAFDWIGFFGAHPRFRQVWRGYCPSTATPGWSVYVRCGAGVPTR